MINGILPINKPNAMSSYDIIRYLKSKVFFRIKNLKIGHGGTLDPIATGVLPILLGNATKLFNFLNLFEKSYKAEIQLGAFTDSDDITGNIINEFYVDVSIEKINNTIKIFEGTITQIPPLYSAIRVNGKRGYELVRNNINFQPKPRKVEIKELRLISYDEVNKIINIFVKCSSGTYIRSLARDIGKELGCGGYIKNLIREESFGIHLNDCVELEKINSENFQNYILDINKVLNFIPELHPKISKNYILNGRVLNDDNFEEDNIKDGLFRVVKDEILLAIIEKKQNCYRYIRVFNE